MTDATYTDSQATDEAVLLLVRKLRRLHPDAFADVIGRLSDGARDALSLAENRADVARAHAARDGVTRRFVTIAERCEADL